jgi:uncharacterized protein (DUF2225 family)
MATATLAYYAAQVQNLKLQGWLNHHLQKKELNKRKLSRLLGKNDAYLQQLAHKGDFSGSHLVALGNYLDTDPFEPYRPLLHLQARSTATERAQAARITELEQKIQTLEQELAWFKDVVKGR